MSKENEENGPLNGPLVVIDAHGSFNIYEMVEIDGYVLLFMSPFGDYVELSEEYHTIVTGCLHAVLETPYHKSTFIKRNYKSVHKYSFSPCPELKGISQKYPEYYKSYDLKYNLGEKPLFFTVELRIKEVEEYLKNVDRNHVNLSFPSDSLVYIKPVYELDGERIDECNVELPILLKSILPKIVLLIPYDISRENNFLETAERIMFEGDDFDQHNLLPENAFNRLKIPLRTCQKITFTIYGSCGEMI